MKNAASDIVDDVIEEQISAAETQRLGTFVESVEEGVEQRVTQLRAVYGDAIEDVAGEAMSEAQSYREAQLQIFDPNFHVKDTQAEGAAAWNDKSDNSIAVGHSAMEREKDAGYWRRVAKHEVVHQKEQVAVYNRGSISYPEDPNLEVNPTLVEWHAITKANQPDSDLTPDYIAHKRRGDELVSFLGGSQRLIAALESGDMQALQDHINELLMKQEEEIPEEALEPALAA